MTIGHIGFISNDDYYLQHCGVCGSENYMMAVPSGQCAWCGADARTPGQKARQELAANASDATKTVKSDFPND